MTRALIALFVFFISCSLVSAANPAPAPLEPDSGLNANLHSLLNQLHFQPQVDGKRFAVSVVDVTDPAHPKYAGVNDTVMMYAASLPKIAILLAGFERWFGRFQIRKIFLRGSLTPPL